MSTSRRTKPSGTGAVAAVNINSATARAKTRTTTPLPERIATRTSTGVDPFNTNKENTISSAKLTSRPSRTKPFVPQIVKNEKDGTEPRARWSSSCVTRPRGRSASPCEFGRVNDDIRKTRVSRVSNERIDRNERSVSVDRSARVRDNRVSLSNKANSRVCEKSEKFEKSEKNDQMRAKNEKVEKVAENKVNVNVRGEKGEKHGEMRAKNVKVEKGVEKSEASLESVMKVSESVKMFERFKSKSNVGLRASTGAESEESGGRLSFGGSSGLSGSSVKYPSKLHGKLAFLEEKVKRIASDIKRTKEMLDLNNPDASKVMLSDIQETVAGIEKAMGDVVSGEKEKKNVEISVVKKNSPVKESSDVKSLAKGLNNDELEARLFPHHKLLRDRTTLKAPLGSHESIKAKVAVTVIEAKQDEKPLSDVVENCKAIVLLSDSSSKLESKVTVRGGSEICEVQETEESGANSRARDSFNSGKGNDVPMLAADETLEDFDDEENKPVMVFDVEFDDSGNDQLNEIGNKTCTGGWFLSEGESALLAHDDGSCSFYDVVNSEVKSVYKPPAGLSPNLWRDCWIVRALGADGCSARYVVAASAGNSMDSGFCSWDFYTREIKSFHIEDGVTHTRTALAPLSNNALNRRHDLSNLTPENRQWWYKPCGPLIVTTASNQKVVKVFDIRDGEHVMKWDVQSHVVAMDNSSPLQWRNRGKVVLAETENVSLWDVGSLTPEPLLTISSSGKKISALHVNNTDAELGGGVRQRVSSSEAEGNDGVFCTSDSINVLDFRHPSGIGLRIPKYGNTVHSVFSRGDSIYLGCSGSSSTTRKPTSSPQIQQFSLRRQKLFSTYMLPESNAHSHYKAITQVWGNSNLTMGVSGLGLFVFDALKDDGSRPLVSDYGSGQKVRETIGPDNLYSPSFDYLGSRALLISRDRPACWKYLS